MVSCRDKLGASIRSCRMTGLAGKYDAFLLLLRTHRNVPLASEIDRILWGKSQIEKWYPAPNLQAAVDILVKPTLFPARYEISARVPLRIYPR